VVQGERELVADCRSLARFKLGGIPPMTAGMARLKVTFTVDADGILSVSACEEHTGQEASIRVKPSYGLTDDEVERMIRDSFDHADDDMGLRLLTVERVEADRILNATQVALVGSADLLLPGEADAISAAMARLASAKAGTDHLAIRSVAQALDEASKEFARRRMNAALDQNVRGQALDAVEKKVTPT
jgi:molecular chaperone HscA